MSLSIGIILTVILIALLVVSKRSKTSAGNRPSLAGHGQMTSTNTTTSTTTTEFHAVSIQTMNSACEAAKSLQGKRYLAGAAPRIPLAECDATECKCRFIHHADRRSGADRRGHVPPNMIASTGGHSGKERRYRERRGSNEPRDFFA